MPFGVKYDCENHDLFWRARGPAALGKAAVGEGRMLRKKHRKHAKRDPFESIPRSIIRKGLKMALSADFQGLSCQFRSSQIQSVTNAKLVPTVVDAELERPLRSPKKEACVDRDPEL